MAWSFPAIDAWNIPGYILLAVLSLAITQSIIGSRPRWWFFPTMLTVGVALRILGAVVRYELNRRYYGGSGDALEYFYQGIYRIGDYGLLTTDYWTKGRWWGTIFLTRFSGLVTTFIGPTKLGEFLTFGIIAFLGITAIVLAFYKVQPGPEAGRLAHIVWIWPSLWFWPTSIGKEALLIFAIGLTTLGYAGHEKRINWPLYFIGLGIAFSIRPHVAAVLAVATMGAHWLSDWRGLTPRRLAEGLVILAIALISLRSMQAQLGFDADLEGVRDFMQKTAAQTQKGGSSIKAATLTPTGLPLAFVNVWFRPFPWEAHSTTALIAAGELVLLWFLVWQRRKSVKLALKYWRHHRMLQFAVPFLLLYTLMIGLSFANLGIIARQRTPLYPFVFMFMIAIPDDWVPEESAKRNPARLF